MIKRSALADIFLKRQTIIKTNLWVIQIISTILVVYLVIMGTVIYSTSKNLFKFQYRTDENCLSYPCEFHMRLDQDINAKNLFIYIGFEDFFVDHRKVADSISYPQLEGAETDINNLMEDCKGYYSLEMLLSFFPSKSNYDPQSRVIKPCGLYPLLYTQCWFIS